MQFNRLVSTRWGMMCVNQLDKNIGKLLIAYGEFSKGETDLFAALIKQDDICLDVGANIGALTLPMARMCKLVLAFEPQEYVYHLLCANLALNSITNVRALQFAVSDNREPMMIPILDPRIPNNFGGIDIRQPAPSRQRVESVTIDDLDLPKCAMIKIDVEGMELAVLRGAQKTIQRHRPLLYVENDRVENEVELLNALLSLGYKLYDHFPPLFDPDNFRRCDMNFFEAVFSLNLLAIPSDGELPFPLEQFGLKPRTTAEPHLAPMETGSDNPRAMSVDAGPRPDSAQQ